MLIAYVPIAFVNVRNSRALYKVQFDLTESDRDREYHERLLTGRLEAKEVRAFGLAGLLRRRHDELFEQRIMHTRRVVKKRAVVALIGSAITATVLVATLATVMVLALDGHITVGDAAVAVVALRQLASQLRGVNEATNSMIEGVVFLRDFESFRASLPDTEPRLAQPPPIPSTITVCNLGYRYSAGVSNAFTNVSLELHTGQVLAIVGPNGSGKSTLAKVLCGLLPPTTGTIKWDDIDVANCEVDAIRKLVSPVFQDFTRYEHAARDAIGFGDITRFDDDDAITAAGVRAGVDGFLGDLPNGYDTRLSTAYAGGAELSVGQWQRIAIARAFFRNAPLVVMDEPAASLDPRSERDLFERLHELGRNSMVVFISHRFATVRRADQIVVLLEGRIVERGTHEELMLLGAVYAEMYTLQAEPFA